MALTNFPNGITSFGVPVVGGGSGPFKPFAKYWFVDGNLGSNGNTGESPEDPFLTMAFAFTRVRSGDVICWRGNIREQISTPAGIFDVSVIGCGNVPRHADAHTGNNGYTAATWKLPASPTAATPLLTVRQQGWMISNGLFDGPTDAAAIQLFRDAGSGDAEDDASHALIIGNKFVAAQNHIEFKGGLSQCQIIGNTFFGSTAASLVNTVGAGVGTNNYYVIQGNNFQDNASHIIVPTNNAAIYGNTIGNFTTTGISLTGGAENAVWGNQLSGTYSIVGGYVAGTNDEWSGNFNSLSGGVTAADPA